MNSQMWTARFGCYNVQNRQSFLLNSHYQWRKNFSSTS